LQEKFSSPFSLIELDLLLQSGKIIVAENKAFYFTDRQIFEISPSSSILEVREDSEKALREVRGRKNTMSKHLYLTPQWPLRAF